MFLTAPEDFKERELSPRVTTRLVWGEKLMLSHVTVQANGPIVPLHSHPHEQMGIVLEGKVGLTPALAQTCRRERLWFHVDAAWGDRWRCRTG